MSTIVNVHEAKTHLSRLLEDVAAGADVVIARAGKPVARLVPIAPGAEAEAARPAPGRIKVPADFNAPLSPVVLADFEGR